MTTINSKQFQSLRNEIYRVLMADPEMGMMQMDECGQKATDLVLEWMKENDIMLHETKSGNMFIKIDQLTSLKEKFYKLMMFLTERSIGDIGEHEDGVSSVIDDWMKENEIELDKKIITAVFVPEQATTPWDAVEVQPVCFIDNGANCEVCDKGQEDFWSVYLHQVEGGVLCVADLPTEAAADKLAELIRNAAKTFQNKQMQELLTAYIDLNETLKSCMGGSDPLHYEDFKSDFDKADAIIKKFSV